MSALLQDLETRFEKAERKPFANLNYLNSLRGRIQAEKMNVSAKQEKHAEVATRKSQMVLNKGAGYKQRSMTRVGTGLKNAIAVADKPKVYLPLQFVV